MENKLSCNLNICETNKFKNVTLMFNIKFPISKYKVASRAILPYIFKKGFMVKGNIESIEEKLEDIYGSKINFTIYKNKVYHVLSFTVTVIDSNLTKNTFINQVLEYISKMIFDSPIKYNMLNINMLEEIKNELRNSVLNIYNNKMNYALQKFLEITYTNENYADFSLGSIEDINKLSVNDVKCAYEEVFNIAECDLFLTGNIRKEELKQELNKFFYIRNNNNDSRVLEKGKNPTTFFNENADINQNILIIGYKTNIADTLDLVTLQIINIIIGKGGSSLLFKKIREEKQLAYYISSLIDINNFGNRLIITSIIDSKKYDEVLKLITEEIKTTHQKIVTNCMLKSAKQELINQVLKSEDHPLGTIDKMLQNKKNGIPKNTHRYINSINSINMDQVVNVLKNLELATVYSLRRGEDGMCKLS